VVAEEVADKKIKRLNDGLSRGGKSPFESNTNSSSDLLAAYKNPMPIQASDFGFLHQPKGARVRMYSMLRKAAAINVICSLPGHSLRKAGVGQRKWNKSKRVKCCALSINRNSKARSLTNLETAIRSNRPNTVY